ncbi:MAG: hypothetical protein KY428_12320 [Bacteroidetes bacterium]|nr:hypothetical protein [Bacteroidota bacterium]
MIRPEILAACAVAIGAARVKATVTKKFVKLNSYHLSKIVCIINIIKFDASNYKILIRFESYYDVILYGSKKYLNQYADCLDEKFVDVIILGYKYLTASSWVKLNNPISWY